MNPEAVAFSPRSLPLASMNPLAQPYSPRARASIMLNPAAKPYSPVSPPKPRLNPLSMPFYPAVHESSTTSESETSTTPASSACSKLSPLASDFTPSITTFSTSLDTNAPTFTSGLAADASAITFITQKSLTAAEGPMEMDFQSAPADEVIFAEDSDGSRAIVNIGSSPSEPSAIEYPMADNVDIENVMSPEPFIHADEAEYNSQKALLHKYPDIHHFNWLGRGVMAQTSTPAAVSLTIALTPPKGRIADEENLRDKTLLQEAMLAVDPVVYYGDINTIRHLTGESMREAAIGASAVFYTPFGKWVNGSYEEDEERPVEDELDVTRYPEDVSVINGWYQFNDAPTRQNFWDEAEYANKSAIAMQNKAVRERKLYGAGSTRLRNVVTVDGSELTVPAKQIPSGDVSGLISSAIVHCEVAAASPPHLLVEKDDCPPDANQIDGLDDKDADKPLTASNTTSVVVKDNLFKNENWADDLDDEDEHEQEPVAVAHAPSAVVDDGLFKNPNWADDIDEEDEDESVAVGDAPSAVVDDGLYKNANWANDLDDEDTSVAASTPPSVIQSPPTLAPTMSNKQAGEGCEESCLPASVSDIISTTEPGKSNKPVPNFRPVISGTGGVRFIPVVPFSQPLQAQLQPESSVCAPAVLSTELPADAFKPGNWEELENDEYDLYGSGSPNASSDSSSTEESLNSSSCSSSSSLEVSLKTAVADETGALEARSQEEIDEEDEFLYGPPGNATSPDESLMPKPLSLPFRPKAAESSITTFNLPFRPKAIEVVREVNGADKQPDNHQPSPLQVIAEQQKPDLPAGSLSDSWETSPAIFSSLGRKKGRSPIKMRSVASDHKDIVIPKLDLVPASLSAMLTTEGDRHAQSLDQIIEEDEEQDTEEEEHESSPNLAIDSNQTTAEEDMVNTKVEKAVEMGHVLLKRSAFCENLPALLPTLAEEDGDSAPVTPEQRLVTPTYERPESRRPNAMLRKSVRSSLPHDGQDESSADERKDELTDGAGIGAIFEDDDEEEGDIDSSILAGAVAHEVELLHAHISLPAPAGTVEAVMGTSSGSDSRVAEIFTASSAGTSAPTSIEESEEGSPAPGVIARPAKRPILVTEPVSAKDITVATEPGPPQAATWERKTSWTTTIKSSFGKKEYHGFTDAAKVQFTPTQRCTSSWTKIENKLHKPKPAAADQEEKKAKKSGFRKALKKVKNAFVKGVKALT